MRILLPMILLPLLIAGPARCDGSAKAQTQRHKPVAVPSRCAQEVVSETGSTRPNEGLARASAIREWRERVRFRLGELYTDNTQAHGARWACAPASTGIIKTYRCEFTARPCKAG